MREEFERWYLQVVKGHPNNLAKDEDGGYRYLGAMYLGWEAATLIEREACAEVCRKRAKAIGETIRTANPRTSEHIMLRRDARLEEANDCAAEIMERSNVEGKGRKPA